MKNGFVCIALACLMLLAPCCACVPRTAPAEETALPSASAEARATEVPSDPASSAEPDPDLIAWYIDNAYPLAERIGREHGIEFDKAAAECSTDKTGDHASVSFPASDGSFALNIGASRSSDGVFEADLSGPFVRFFYGEEELERLTEEVREWGEAFRSELITVTPEDVINAGCTETSGSEYMNTVYRIFAEKLAERYLALDAEAPGACRSAQVMSVEDDSLGDGLIKIAAVPNDLARFCLHTDFEYGFVIDETSEFYGKTFIAGFAVLTQREDGCWVGRSELATGV